MSLLLEALARASSEKERLAAASSPATPVSPVGATDSNIAASTPEKLEQRTPFPELRIEPVLEAVPESVSEPVAESVRVPSRDPVSARAPQPALALALDPTPPTDAAAPENSIAFTPAAPPHDVVRSENASGARAALAMLVAEPPAPARQTPDAKETPLAPAAPEIPELSAARSPTASEPEAGTAAVPARPEGRRPSSSSAANTSSTSSATSSPQIAREILQATAKSLPERRRSRMVILGGLALVGIVINVLFFTGTIDRMLAEPDQFSVVVPAESPVLATPAQEPAADPATDTAALDAVSEQDSTGAATPVAVASAAPSSSVASPSSTQTEQPLKARSDSRVPEPVARTAAPAPVRVFIAKAQTAGALDAAYGQLGQGNFVEAEAGYQRALAKNPGEIDAMIGLAYIARQQGRRDDALDYYQRVLRLQASHPVAMSGVLEVSAEGDARLAASRARELAERNPDSPAALATLGGMLAREGRIGEAQQAYFRALSLEPANAFHAYNLAVALDRLHKTAQAATYYERAIALGKGLTSAEQANFPSSTAESRLSQIRGASGGESPGR